MTDTEITIALAGLEGWQDPKAQNGWVEGYRSDAARCRSFCPRYLHDANAVLPLLEKFGRWELQSRKDGSHRIVLIELETWKQVEASAPTFCRAACIAILKAHGLWREVQAENAMREQSKRPATPNNNSSYVR